MDVVAVNIYPYWDNVKLENSISSIQTWYEELKRPLKASLPKRRSSSPKPAGHPAGRMAILQPAILSANLNAFAEEMGIDYFWFEAYDEAWKVEYEGEAGACWGLWDNQEQLKPEIEKFFSAYIDKPSKAAGDPHWNSPIFPLWEIRMIWKEWSISSTRTITGWPCTSSTGCRRLVDQTVLRLSAHRDRRGWVLVLPIITGGIDISHQDRSILIPASYNLLWQLD